MATALALSADSVLYRQGESADSFYYLETGAVSVGVQPADGERTILIVHGPGTFFGARSLGEEVHDATATTLLESVVFRLAKPAVQDLLRTDPGFARDFAMHMMRRVAGLEEDQIDRAVNSLERRLARALLILASFDAESREPRVLAHMTEAALARMLAAEPSCVGKLLQAFRQAGHVGAGQPLTVYSSLVRVLLPAHLAEMPSPLDALTGSR
jgi:CRP-like cAMP-binding protein